MFIKKEEREEETECEEKGGKKWRSEEDGLD